LRYKLGDSGPAVSDIRERLVRLGLLPSSNSIEFDDEVLSAIKSFQTARGLSVDGMVGADTWARLDEAVWALGDRVLLFTPGHLIHGDDVAQLQQRLSQLGFSCGRVDGIFGKLTDHAVREFQKSVGISADGVVGLDTVQGLHRLAKTVAGGNAAALREKLRHESKRTGIADKVVVLDVGNDPFTDPAFSADAIELASQVVDLLEGKLSALGTTVLLTHSKDGRPTTITRADFANSAAADVLLSVQIGISADPTTHGVSAYHFAGTHGYSVLGVELATFVVDQVVALTPLTNPQIQGKSWPLLRATTMPAVAVDLGYLTHKDDTLLVRDPAVLTTAARGLMNALIKFFEPVGS
jgi:N-acetylmuramoyl-L-alanine amidase